VASAIRFLRQELDVTMALAGVKSVGEITRDKVIA
jgi:isopentenyl diphosphate isomerase/L-lactate dehydrogenase-like FMN-dependent dehydrogenase